MLTYIFIILIPTLLAYIGFYLWFYPKISIINKIIPNPKNILSTQFEISNDGNFPIRNVEISFSIFKLETSDGLTINGGSNFKNRIKEPNSKENKMVPTIKAGEKNTIQFPSGFNIGDNTKFADIAIVINFKFIWKWEKIFRFITSKDSNGHLYWKREPITK
jgi:hypothetical protein